MSGAQRVSRVVCGELHAGRSAAYFYSLCVSSRGCMENTHTPTFIYTRIEQSESFQAKSHIYHISEHQMKPLNRKREFQRTPECFISRKRN